MPGTELLRSSDGFPQLLTQFDCFVAEEHIANSLALAQRGEFNSVALCMPWRDGPHARDFLCLNLKLAYPKQRLPRPAHHAVFDDEFLHSE